MRMLLLGQNAITVLDPAAFTSLKALRQLFVRRVADPRHVFQIADAKQARFPAGQVAPGLPPNEVPVRATGASATSDTAAAISRSTR